MSSTDIQASVIISDKISPTIDRKLEQIAVNAQNASEKIKSLATALSTIRSGNINEIKNALQQLNNINPFKGMGASVNQLVSAQVKAQQALNQQVIATNKLAMSVADLELKQSKLALANQKLATEQAKTAEAQNKVKLAIERTNNAIAQNAVISQREVQSLIATERATVNLESSKRLLEIRTARLNKILSQSSSTYHNNATSIMSMARALTTLSAVGFSVHSIVEVADSYQSLLNRLQLITGTAEVAQGRLASLIEVSTNSYTSIDSIVKLYQRLDMAFKQIGGTATEAMQATETLSKAISLSGLTTAEASSALLQISQAFNKGKLDGDEFRTVMETMPLLSDHIAKKLGVLRGELLDLAPKGKITAQVMRDAMVDMAEDVDRKFSQMTPTIAMQLENLATEAKVYFGSIFTQSGSAQALQNVIKGIADNLDVISKLAIEAGIAFTAMFVVSKANQFVQSFVSIYKSIRDVITVTREATVAMGAMNVASKATGSAITGIASALRATPLSAWVIGLTAVMSLVEGVYSYATGKSLFPSLDQDMQKANDFANRVCDHTICYIFIQCCC